MFKRRSVIKTISILLLIAVFCSLFPGIELNMQEAKAAQGMSVSEVKVISLDTAQSPSVAVINVAMPEIGLTTASFSIKSNSGSETSLTVNDVQYSSGEYKLTVAGMKYEDMYTLTISKNGYPSYINKYVCYGSLITANDMDFEHELNIFPSYSREISEPGVVSIRNNTYTAGTALTSGSVYDAIDSNNGNPDNGSVIRMIGMFVKAPAGAKGVKTLRTNGQMVQVKEDSLIDSNPNYQETVENGKYAYQNNLDPTNHYWETISFLPLYSQIATERQSDNSRILVDPADRFRIIEWYDNVDASGNCTGTPMKVERLTVKVEYPGTVQLDHNGAVTQYPKIQDAVNASADGDTVLLGAGTFREQVTITKNITLKGAGMDQTIIESPDRTSLAISGGNWKTIKGQKAVAIVGIKTDSASGKVTVKDLTVDGRDQGYLVDALSLSLSEYAFQGIGVFNTNADIDSVKVTRVREISGDGSVTPPLVPEDYLPQDQPSGFNHNEGIFAESAEGSALHTVSIKNSYITKFQKTGILAWGPTLFADIENNTIQGYGQTLYSTGNGIQVSSSDYTPYGGGDRRGTTAVIKNNKILEIGVVIPEPGQPASYLNLGLFGPGGILLYEAGSGVEITGNKVTGPGVLPWHNSDTSNDGGYSNDGIIIDKSPEVYVADNEVSDFSIGISENAVDASSKATVTGNSFSNNLMDIRTGQGNDEINLKDGSNIVSYYQIYNGTDTISDNGTDTISNFGTGDAINVVGFTAGSVNGCIGADPIYMANTEGVQTINGYHDAHLVTDFTGGTVTTGSGINVEAHSVQMSVSGKTTTLYIDTDGMAGAAELTVKLNGIYSTSNFILDGGYIRFTGDAPSITSQPENRSITVGQTTSFTVNATETAPLSYQWKKNGVDLADGGNISGANTATLTVSNAAGEDAGNYTCYISNVVGNVTSNAATLTVNPAGTFTLVNTPGSNHVSLNWNSVPEAAYYGVYKDNICITTLAAIDLSFDATGLTNGDSYEFFIKAMDNSYVLLAESNKVIAVPYTTPGTPANVTATAGNGQATVTFTPPADNGGSAVTGYEVTANPGNITVTTTGTSIVVPGLSNGTAYTFTVKAVNAAGSSAASAPSKEVTPYNASDSSYHAPSEKPAETTVKTPTQVNSGVDVLVNGKAENAGVATNSKQGDKTVTTIAVDPVKLEQKLEQEGNNAKVTIPVKSSSDIIIGELNGQMVKSMEAKAAVIEVKTDSAAYTLPAQQIRIEDISAKFGTNVELKDIKVQIQISSPTSETAKIVENAASKGNYTVVAPSVDFTVTCTYGGKTTTVTSFKSYVQRQIAIPEGVDPSKITTGVVTEQDGTVRHVPTKITVVEGKYYAIINSLTNSTYSVVWHPLEFSDVSGHWAKEAVNDMGSRLVISGYGNGTFAPDKDITRAEFSAIVVRALGLKPEMGDKPFDDVSSTDWYAPYVETAYKYNIISGYGDGKFGPMDMITREQAMTMIAKAMKITSLKVEFGDQEAQELLAGFKDSSKASGWAEYSISECVKSGIVSGKEDNRLAPKDDITRAEVAVIVRKLLQKSGLI